ncbi:hypothetical protein TIFTF001_035598 [Ficus carica]|uniref:Uncharacterized protein n=1 Tax=Ficus carica TaxID=3494 RepID=A0AA88E537_FICCA|nr:hypothetical protein TIFTF001_035598 [Ficus carica]
MKNTDRYWQDRYFFMLVNNKSIGGLANAFYPLWGLLRKKLGKPPPKDLLFEKKLERLLAHPNREWDEICVTSRLKSLSLWKDFVEIETGIIKQIPSWVDWPFVIRGALRRLFCTPLYLQGRRLRKKATKAAAATAASRASEPPPLPLIKSSTKPSNVPVQLPTKKRKMDEKSKKKVPAKKKKAAKVLRVFLRVCSQVNESPQVIK